MTNTSKTKNNRKFFKVAGNELNIVSVDTTAQSHSEQRPVVFCNKTNLHKLSNNTILSHEIPVGHPVKIFTPFPV